MSYSEWRGCAALASVLAEDELCITSEFGLYVVVGVWADRYLPTLQVAVMVITSDTLPFCRQVALEKGEEWDFPDAPGSDDGENGSASE